MISLANPIGLTRLMLGHRKYFDKSHGCPFPDHIIKQANVFVLSNSTNVNLFSGFINPKTEQTYLEKFSKNHESPIDLAFPVTILESQGGFCRTLTKNTSGNVEKGVLYSILCQELAPNNYRFHYFAYGINDGMNVVSITPVRPDGNEFVLRGIMRMVFNNRKAAFGEETINETIKIKKRRGCEYHKVRKITHVTLDGEQSFIVSPYGGKIEWQHSWEVRGHWRHCIGLGKDRCGEYCIPGYTWIKDHKKGDGPLIKKTRYTTIAGEKKCKHIK